MSPYILTPHQCCYHNPMAQNSKGLYKTPRVWRNLMVCIGIRGFVQASEAMYRIRGDVQASEAMYRIRVFVQASEASEAMYRRPRRCTGVWQKQKHTSLTIYIYIHIYIYTHTQHGMNISPIYSPNLHSRTTPIVECTH